MRNHKKVHITIAVNGEHGLFLNKPYSSLDTALSIFRNDALIVARELESDREQPSTIGLEDHGSGLISNGV